MSETTGLVEIHDHNWTAKPFGQTLEFRDYDANGPTALKVIGNAMERLSVPTFARISDYVGLWAMQPSAFDSFRHLAFSMDLKSHVERGAEPLQSALEKVPGPGGRAIALVRVQGVLMKSQSSFGGTSTVQMRRDIRMAAADPDVAGLLLLVDSPGGTVAGTMDLAAEVKEARKSKPVWAHVDDLTASAAYWVASQAERITANNNAALIGSIGTLQVIQDMSAAAEQAGIKTLVIATGPLKGMGTPGSKVTEEQIAHVQDLVNSVQVNFDQAVQKGRGLTDKQLAAVRTGGVFTAPDALDRKLIDGIQSLTKTVQEFSAVLKVQKNSTVALENPSSGVVLSQESLPRLRLDLPKMQ